MARPLKEIDPEQVKKLASINCTMDEIASVLGCSKDTLERRFAAIIKEGRDQGRTSLKRYMWQAAQKGNVTMMIWLSKNILGYADKITTVDESEHKSQKLIINLSGTPFIEPKKETESDDAPSSETDL